MKDQTIGVLDSLISRAKAKKRATIAYAETNDPRVISATQMCVKENLCTIALVGSRKQIERDLDAMALKKVIIYDPAESDLTASLAEQFYEMRKHKGVTPEMAQQQMQDPMYFACMLLSAGKVDGLVAGAVLKSADVMRPAFQIIRSKPNINKVSSCFLMEDKRTVGGAVIFADCGVIPHPTADDLADIALASSVTAKILLNEEPRVALLSYSTNASKTDDETILKVKEALQKVKNSDKTLVVDGEMQADVALCAETAKRKMPGGKICGNANVLVFPDLDAGNIGYKLVQQFSGARAIGPILQGLNKPVNDLSRGTTAEEIFLQTAITILQI